MNAVFDAVLVAIPAHPDPTERLVELFSISREQAASLASGLPKVVKHGAISSSPSLTKRPSQSSASSFCTVSVRPATTSCLSVRNSPPSWGRSHYRSRRAGWGRAWWKRSIEEMKESRTAVLAIVDEVIASGTPPEMIVIVGFSQGAALAMDVALHHQNKLGGVAMLSGMNEAQYQWNGLYDGRGELAVFISHGHGDPILPFRKAERFAKELTENDFRVEFVPFGGGHTIPPDIRTALASFVGARL